MENQQIFIQVVLAFGRNSVKPFLKQEKCRCLKSFSLNFRPTLKQDSKFFRLWSKSILFVKLFFFVWHCISFSSSFFLLHSTPSPPAKTICVELLVSFLFHAWNYNNCSLSCLLSFFCCARRLELHKKLWIAVIFIQQSRQQQKRSFALRLLS